MFNPKTKFYAVRQRDGRWKVTATLNRKKLDIYKTCIEITKTEYNRFHSGLKVYLKSINLSIDKKGFEKEGMFAKHTSRRHLARCGNRSITYKGVKKTFKTLNDALKYQDELRENKRVLIPILYDNEK